MKLKLFTLAVLLLINMNTVVAQTNTNTGTDAGNAGTYNSAFGYYAGNIVTGSNNSFVGYFAGQATTTGIYYWRVRAIDRAGNVGTNSAVFKFTLN